jgi:hypothetical protein
MSHLFESINQTNEIPITGELFCTICGCIGDGILFKKGYLCDKCILYVKTYRRYDNPLNLK